MEKVNEKKHWEKSLEENIGKKVVLDSQNNHSYRITLSNDISKGHDLISLTLSQKPTGLDFIELLINNETVKILEVKGDDIKINENLLSCEIPLSKCYLSPICSLVFHFDKTYLEEHESYELVDEWVEKEEYLDEEIEIFDGYEKHIGKPVTRLQVHTCKKIKRIIQGVESVIPNIQLETKISEHNANEHLRLPIWQYYKTFPIDDPQQLRRLVHTYELTPLHYSNDKSRYLDLEELIKLGQPFQCKIRNYVDFVSGLAHLYIIY